MLQLLSSALQLDEVLVTTGTGLPSVSDSLDQVLGVESMDQLVDINSFK